MTDIKIPTNYNFVNLVGRKYGRLLVISFNGIKTKQASWLCKCDCGNEKIILGSNLKNGVTKSCGCLRKQLSKEKQLIHNKCNSTEYYIWVGMKQRCHNPNNKDYIRYGKRGIKVCDRWFRSFANFYADMGERPSKSHSIDRIDNNGNYELSNCRWATVKEQAENRCRSIIVDIDGLKMTLTDACYKYNIKYVTVYRRVSINNMSYEDALKLDLLKGEEKTCNGKNRLRIAINGKLVLLKNACIEKGINYITVRDRINSGFSIEDAFHKPIKIRKILTTE